MNINNLIKKSLEFYDNQNAINYKYLFNSQLLNRPNEEKVLIVDEFNFDNIKLEASYEILGIFDNQTKVWIWSWLLPNMSLNEILISKKLLDYGLKLEPSSNTHDHFYIKSQLTNSRILIENNIELDIHLAIISYLVKDLYLFIYPKKIYYNEEKTKYLICYYIIK